ncbi:hypothetical protein QP150_03950 [Sphingomonas sp. 22L2VL55-3]
MTRREIWCLGRLDLRRRSDSRVGDHGGGKHQVGDVGISNAASRFALHRTLRRIRVIGENPGRGRGFLSTDRSCRDDDGEGRSRNVKEKIHVFRLRYAT